MTGAIGMMFGNQTPPVVAGGATGTSYFSTGSAGSYLNGTFATAVGSGEFTWETWMWLDNINTGDHCLFDTRSSGGSSAGFFIYYTPASSTISFATPGGTGTSTSSGMSSDAWVHLAVVRTSTTIRLFVDGVFKTSATQGRDFSDTPWRVGAFIDGTSTSEVWKGYLDNMRISNNIRYASTTTFTPPTQLTSDANTYLLFNFNGTNGSTSFTEDGPNNRTVTRNGTGTSLSSAQFKS